MKKVLFLIVMMVVFAGNNVSQQGFINSASAQLNLNNLVRACLPLQGRMLPNPLEECHCPPESYCPQSDEEWVTHPRMPGDQAIICCDIPGNCNISVQVTGRACPGVNEFSRETIEVCSGVCTSDCLSTFGDITDLNLAQWNGLQACLAGCEGEASNETQVGGDPIGDADTDLNRFYSSNVWTGDDTTDIREIEELSEEIESIDDFSTVSQTVPDSEFSLQPSDELITTTKTDTTTPEDFTRETTGEDVTSSGGANDNNDSTTPEEPACTTYTLSVCISTFIADSCNGTAPFNDCLAPDSKVLMADGSYKSIDSISVGDLVQSDTAVNTVRKIKKKEWEEVVLYSVNGSGLRFTADHPIMTNDGWKAINYDNTDEELIAMYGLKDVGKLQVGDHILSEKGAMEVKEITPSETVSGYTTYNLELDGTKTFYANGILVRSN